jgi:hypothetical protein
MNGKSLEEIDCGLMEVLFRRLPGGTEKTTKNVIQVSRCPGRDSSSEPPEYKPQASSLLHAARFDSY